MENIQDNSQIDSGKKENKRSELEELEAERALVFQELAKVQELFNTALAALLKVGKLYESVDKEDPDNIDIVVEFNALRVELIRVEERLLDIKFELHTLDTYINISNTSWIKRKLLFLKTRTESNEAEKLEASKGLPIKKRKREDSGLEYKLIDSQISPSKSLRYHDLFNVTDSVELRKRLREKVLQVFEERRRLLFEWFGVDHNTPYEELIIKFRKKKDDEDRTSVGLKTDASEEELRERIHQLEEQRKMVMESLDEKKYKQSLEYILFDTNSLFNKLMFTRWN